MDIRASMLSNRKVRSGFLVIVLFPNGAFGVALVLIAVSYACGSWLLLKAGRLCARLEKYVTIRLASESPVLTTISISRNNVHLVWPEQLHTCYYRLAVNKK